MYFAKNRLKWRDVTPSRSPNSSIEPSSNAPSEIGRNALFTVVEVPCQAGVPGEASGRQRKQGRYPASDAAAADKKNVQLLAFGILTGQIGRQ